MQIEHFRNIDCYRQTTINYLLKQEVAHHWMLNFCSRKKSNNLPHTIVISENGLVLGTAIVSLPDMLVLSKFVSETAIQKVADDLIANNISLTGVIAPQPEATIFARIWQSFTKLSYRLNFTKRTYKLEKVKPIDLANGCLRLATKRDRTLLIEWLKAFDAELSGEQKTDSEYQDWYDLRMSQNSLYLWQDNIPVSMAVLSSSSRRTNKIHSVYTPLKYRRQGYAGSCVTNLSQMSLDRGNKYCFISADLANLESNNIYQKIGCQPACDFDNYLFSTV